jgi:hypothetical protein
MDRIESAEAVTEAFLSQWVRLLSTPPRAAVDSGRDRRHLAAMFDPATDEVWDALVDLCGADAIARLRRLLIDG